MTTANSHSKITAFILLLLFSNSLLAEQPSELSDAEENLLVLIGYVGMADYCWAYGVDYRELAHQVRDSLVAEAEAEDRRLENLVYFGLEAAARGNVYSPSVGDMISLADSTDIKQACDNIYVQIQNIARMR